MGVTTVVKQIHAPVERVFEVISDVRNFSKAVPDVVKVEMLSEVTSGVGTRFRETRMMFGSEAATELELTEFVENERVRFVADSHGTVWDSVYTLTHADGVTEMKLTMVSTPHTMKAKLMTPALAPVLKMALEKDMDAVKAYCEG